MNKNGFISSALLYGILVLSLIIMLSIVGILGSRKLSTDKLKENALENSEDGYVGQDKVYAWYDVAVIPANDVWNDQSGKGNNAKIVGENYFDGSYNSGKNIKGSIFLGNAYVDTGIKLNKLESNFTVSMVVSLLGSGVLVGGYDEAAKEGLKVSFDKESKEILACYGNGTDFNCLKTAIPNEYSEDSLIKLTIVVSESGIFAYIDDKQCYEDGCYVIDSEDNTEHSATGGGAIAAGNYNLVVGANVSGNGEDPLENRVSGRLLSLVVYKDNLTSSEVKDNFVTDSGKFNLVSK